MPSAGCLGRLHYQGQSANFSSQVNNGWRVNYGVTPFIADRLFRTSVNRIGHGVHIAQKALYFGAQTDAANKPLTGAFRYEMHSPPEQTPPVDAFWSLILYGADYFLVRNPIDRDSSSDHTEGLAHNPDGSLDITIQHGAPENWLPAPADPFRLVLRTYQPRPEILNQTWEPPHGSLSNSPGSHVSVVAALTFAHTMMSD
jgi:hypothetical protein